MAVSCLTGAPAFAQKAEDHEGFCIDDNEWCKHALVQFRKWYPKALRGDYQAQRNVAFYLWEGGDGAVVKNRVASCTWRMIILSSGSTKIDDSDTGWVETCKEKLSSAEWLAVSGQLQNLLPRVGRR